MHTCWSRCLARGLPSLAGRAGPAPVGRVARQVRCAAKASADRKHYPSKRAEWEVPEDLDKALPEFCGGCGVKLQRSDTNLPGYYTIPARLRQAYEEGELTEVLAAGGVQAVAAAASAPMPHGSSAAGREDDIVVLDPLAHTRIQDPELEDMFDSWLEDAGEKVEPERRHKRHVEQEPHDPVASLFYITCARCHKLVHEYRVKSEAADAAVPDFDLAGTISKKIQRSVATTTVIAVVVDAADFDGSLPRAAVLSLVPKTWSRGTRDKLPFEIVLVVNKVDALPSKLKNTRLDAFVRRRNAAAGLPTPAAVHFVSSVRRTGIASLMEDLVSRVGIKGDLWIVGAQNAGKSSLINALLYEAGKSKAAQNMTACAMPGTTLGVNLVTGLPLLPRSRCFDTPGVPHRHQLTSRLSPEDVKMLLARQKALKPRTYVVKAGQTLLLGGVARVDALTLPARTIYLTVWATDLLPLHLGGTEDAAERWERFVGRELRPPSGGSEDVQRCGKLVPQRVLMEGSNWKHSTQDMCIAGLGWIALGAVGPVELRVWTYEGVSITTRGSLLLDFALQFERPGWSASAKALFKHLPAATAAVEAPAAASTPGAQSV